MSVPVTFTLFILILRVLSTLSDILSDFINFFLRYLIVTPHLHDHPVFFGRILGVLSSTFAFISRVRQGLVLGPFKYS